MNDNDDTAATHARAYNPRWIRYISRILEDLYDGTRSARNDHTTKRIMHTALLTLAKGVALSEAQKATLLESIRVRLGEYNFTWDGPVKLTRNQRPGAQKLLAHWKESVDRETLAPANQAIIADLLARVSALESALANIQLDSSAAIEPKPHVCSSNDADLPHNLLEQNGFPGLTKRNETERNHGVDMSCPSGGVNAMRDESGDHHVTRSTGTSIAREDHHFRASRRSASLVTISYFRQDSSRAPSARLEIGDQKFNLVFHSADVAEEKLRKVCSADWLHEFDLKIGANLRAYSRAYSTTDKRYVISPLYADGDSYGRRDPVLANRAAILSWGDDLQPTSVLIVTEKEPVEVQLRPFKSGSPKAPTHKGSLDLAA